MEKDKVKVCSLSEYEIYKDTDHEIDYDYMYDSIIDTITRAKEEYNISYLPKRYLYDICDIVAEQGVPKDENILYSLLSTLNNCSSFCTWETDTSKIIDINRKIVESLGKNMSDRIKQSIISLCNNIIRHKSIKLFYSMIDHDVVSREEINESFEKYYFCPDYGLGSWGLDILPNEIPSDTSHPAAKKFFKELYEKNKWKFVDEIIESVCRRGLHTSYISGIMVGFGIDNYDMLNKMLLNVDEGQRKDVLAKIHWKELGVSPECLENLVMSMGVPAQNIHDFYVKNETIINSEVYFYLLNKILEKTEGFRSHVSRGYEDMVKTKNLLIKNSNKYSNHPKYKEYLFKTAKKELDFSKNSSEFEELINKDKATREEVMDIWNRIKSPLVALYIKTLEVCKRSGLRDTFCDIMSELVYKRRAKAYDLPIEIDKHNGATKVPVCIFGIRIPWTRRRYNNTFHRYKEAFCMWESQGEYYLIDHWKDGRSKFDLHIADYSARGVCFETLEDMSKKVEGVEGKTKIIKYCINKYIKSSNAYENFSIE